MHYNNICIAKVLVLGQHLNSFTEIGNGAGVVVQPQLNHSQLPTPPQWDGDQIRGLEVRKLFVG